jgi:hypothetical protein
MVFRQRGDCSFLLFPRGEFSEEVLEDEEMLEDEELFEDEDMEEEDVEEPVSAEATVGAVKAATQPGSISP